MTSFFTRKTVLFGLLLLLFVGTLSCGQLSLGDHGRAFSIGTPGCGTALSVVFPLSQNGLFMLMGTLSLFIVLNIFMRHFLRQEIFYTLDPLKHLVIFILKQKKIIPNKIREAFRKGIIHSQIYGTVTIGS